MFLDRLLEKSHTRFSWDISGQSVPAILCCSIVLFKRGLNDVMNGKITSSQFQQHWLLRLPVLGDLCLLCLHVRQTELKRLLSRGVTLDGDVIRGAWHQDGAELEGSDHCLPN